MKVDRNATVKALVIERDALKKALEEILQKPYTDTMMCRLVREREYVMNLYIDTLDSHIFQLEHNIGF